MLSVVSDYGSASQRQSKIVSLTISNKKTSFACLSLIAQFFLLFGS